MVAGCAGSRGVCISNDNRAEECAYYRNLAEILCGCVSYSTIKVRREVLNVDRVINGVSDTERCVVHRFGMIKDN